MINVLKIFVRWRNGALESMRAEDQLDVDCSIVSGPKGIAPAAEIKLYTHVYKTGGSFTY